MDLVSGYSVHWLRNLNKEYIRSYSPKISDFACLKDNARNLNDSLNVSITFVPLNKHSVSCDFSIMGNVNVDCQRCLEEVAISININMNWIIYDDEEWQPKEAENSQLKEYVSFSNYSGIMEILGQEILLSIPMIAKHDIIDCPSKGMITDETTSEQETKAVKANSAFDILKTLKR